MYERIIVPLDGTPFGEHAVTWATEIAIRSDARLELVHIHVPAHLENDLFAVPTFHYTGVVEADARHDREALRREVGELEERARRLAAETGLRVTSRTITGDVDVALEREARNFGADLIVMSTHARTGIERVRFGSIGDAVVRHATVPVLLVRPPAVASMLPATPVFDRILVGLDGSMLSEQIIGPVARIAGLFDATVHLVHVSVPPGDPTFSRIIHTEDDRSMRVELTANQYLAHVSRTWSAAIESARLEVRRAPSPLHGILDIVGETDPKLIALATHGRKGLRRMLLGSTAGDVLSSIDVPVLLFRPRHRAWGRVEIAAIEHSMV